MKVAFCHPDLGIGGAERLVIDAASELKSHNHDITIFTTHHDKTRCFKETIDGSLPEIKVYGDWIPRHIFHKMYAFMANLRCLILAIIICFKCWKHKIYYDVIFVDIVSSIVPLFKLLLPKTKILFYCHFPDLKLTQRKSLIKKLYRVPLDTLEEWSIGFADKICVNSDFTFKVFQETFTKLSSNNVKPDVLYPAVNVPSLQDLENIRDFFSDEIVDFILKPDSITFLSINRYERKKNVKLAIESLHYLLNSCDDYRAENQDISVIPQLIIAGGYDARLTENVEYFEELENSVLNLNLSKNVKFLKSCDDVQKHYLLKNCCAGIYTPENEHFGIVPLEFMSYGKKVIACNSGGPCETVTKETGYLCEPRKENFARAMSEIWIKGNEINNEKIRDYVLAKFSKQAFGCKLDAIIKDLVLNKELKEKKL